jgi:hypothetical protein
MASLLLPDDQNTSPVEPGLLGPGFAPASDNFDDIVRRAITGGFARNLRPSEETEDRRIVDPTWSRTMKARAAVDALLGRQKRSGAERFRPYPDHEPPPDAYTGHIVTNPILP